LQEELCEENFEKLCQITFTAKSVKEIVQKCYTPVNKVCDGNGPETCRTVYETSCTTKYVDKQNGTKHVGNTSCEKIPVKICGPGCSTIEGDEECHDKEIDSVISVPEEVCDLNPHKVCRLIIDQDIICFRCDRLVWQPCVARDFYYQTPISLCLPLSLSVCLSICISLCLCLSISLLLF
jgi:hypothetical protein